MPKIMELYAYVMADKDDNDEGAPAVEGPHAMVWPLMGADLERARGLREIAMRVARERGKCIKLVRSMGLEVVEVIEP